jgi:hypothetical protein
MSILKYRQCTTPFDAVYTYFIFQICICDCICIAWAVRQFYNRVGIPTGQKSAGSLLILPFWANFRPERSVILVSIERSQRAFFKYFSFGVEIAPKNLRYRSAGTNPMERFLRIFFAAPIKTLSPIHNSVKGYTSGINFDATQ